MGQKRFASLIARVRVRDGAARDAERGRPPRARRGRRPPQRVKSNAEVSLGLTPSRRWQRRPAACAATSAASRDRRIALTAEGEGPHRRRGHRGHGRPDDPRGRPGQQQVHPRAVLHGGPDRGRRVPAVHGRGLRRRPPAARLHDARAGGPGGHHHLAAARVLPQDRARAALRRAQPRLRRVRLLRATASCSRSRRSTGSRTSATPTTTRACPSTRPTRATCSTTTAACCARAACARAPRSRARTCGTSPAAASSRGSSPSCSGRGARRRPARAAASACRPARPGAMAEKGWGVEEMTKQQAGRQPPDLDARGPVMEQAQDRHLLARRLLRLPHVAPRHRRGRSSPCSRRPTSCSARSSTRRSGPRASTWP